MLLIVQLLNTVSLSNPPLYNTSTVFVCLILKVAICLTGLIRDNAAVPEYVRQIFTKIGNDNDIEFDYYCHFWNNDKPYPYEINEDCLGIVALPREDEDSVKQVITTLSPKAVVTNSYSDMFPVFLNNGLRQYIHYNRYLDLFVGKKIDKNFFVTLDEADPTTYFDAWWRLHTDWIGFAHLTSQFFAAAQCLKTIVNSGIQYDAILKWRYDQLFLTTHCHIDRLVTNLRLTHRNQIAVEWMCRGGFEISEIINITNHAADITNYANRNGHNPLDVTVGDHWWIVDQETADFISNYLTIAYANIRKYQTIFWLQGQGQHAFFYYALWSLNIDFRIVGPLGINMIRDATILPPLDDMAELDIIDSPLALKLAGSSNQKSRFAINLDQSLNKKHVYDTIKHFNFLSKETL